MLSLYIIAIIMLPFVYQFIKFIFDFGRYLPQRRRVIEYPLLEDNPGIRPVYNDSGFKKIGTVYSQSTTDDSVLDLYEQAIDRNSFRYKALRNLDSQTFFLNNGEKMSRLENNATVQITGLENAGVFVVNRTNTLLYWPF